ncbi:hypothetical protein Vadar_009218 [Vaccinium darrowii]|uniref:Uncharacterized protein n=1 Tax=Vaccinium darrowii TaxID=229202 RepID=A0ACB7ZCK4_9ERIC|nr:hypothetical protein Vadar_009218 [Vaccinium darrowii]
MQAKCCHVIPPIFTASPAKSMPANKVSSPVQISRAISITAPSDLVSTRDVVDDSTAAFRDYQSLWVSQRSETADPITLRVVDGAIPVDFPSGTYYLTGPGLFSDDHGSTVHPLDGHGYLRSFKIDGAKGEVKFMARYIETEAQVEERDPETGRWRFTHRGPFSVLKGGKMVGNTKVMKNVANTSVLRWGRRLLCLWEGGEPYEIESTTLETVGKVDVIDGGDQAATGRGLNVDVWDAAAAMLKPILYGVFNMPPKRFLSHYKIDGRRNRLMILSCNAEDMLLPRSHFTFYEFDSNFKLVQRREFDIPDHLMIHDWAFTDSHYILFGNRIKLDIPGSMAAVCGISPMISALSVNPSKPTSPIYLLPRFPLPSDQINSSSSSSERDWRVPIEAPSQMWVLHISNAFEEKDENGNSEIQIQASGCSYRWFNFQKLFVKPLNQWSKPADFPVINQEYSGRKNSYIYAATSSGARPALPHFPFDTVVKLNTLDNSTRTWSVGTRRFVGEPIFVPSGTTQEDDGYILVVEYAVATQRCNLIVLNSKRIGEANALVARLAVPKNLNFPLGFHGFWDPC